MLGYRRKERKVPAISNVRLLCFLPHDGRIKTVTCRSSSMCNWHYHKLLRLHWWSIISMLHEVHGEERIVPKNNYNTSVIIAMLSSVPQSKASRIISFV